MLESLEKQMQIATVDEDIENLSDSNMILDEDGDDDNQENDDQAENLNEQDRTDKSIQSLI